MEYKADIKIYGIEERKDNILKNTPRLIYRFNTIPTKFCLAYL